MKRFDVAPHSGADPELGLLIATLNDGTREWRENLGTPPKEAVIWQAYPNGPSIGGCILHMASCESYWIEQFVDDLTLNPEDPAVKYDLSMDQYIPNWPAPPNQPIEWYFKVQDDTRKRAVARITRHAEPLTVHPRKNEMYTYRWIVAHVVEHDSYHGGQAVLLHEIWKKTNRR